MTVRETVDARKERIGEGEVSRFLGKAKTVTVAKGKKSIHFDVNSKTDWSEIEKIALGRSGNLRAPTIVVGKKALVGFSADVWNEFFA